MPKVFNRGPDSLLIIYEQSDIRDFLSKAANPVAKYSLTKEGHYAVTKSEPCLLEQLSKQFNFLRIQHKTLEEWRKQYMIGGGSNFDLMQVVIQHEVINIMVPHENERYKQGLALAHLNTLNCNFHGYEFATPLWIMPKLVRPLNLIAGNDTSLGASPGASVPQAQRTFDIYYDIFSNAWMVEIYDQINIIDMVTDNILGSIKYSITAMFPIGIESRSATEPNFKLIQMTLEGPKQYIEAFDCFLCTQHSWNQAFIDLDTLLVPLTTYIANPPLADGMLNTQAQHLLNLVKDGTNPPIIDDPVQAWKRPKTELRKIVSDLGFLIVLRHQGIFRELKIGRELVIPSLPNPTAPPLTPPPLLPQIETYDMVTLHKRMPPNDFDSAGFNRLELNRNGGHGLCLPPTDGASWDLAKDFGKELIFAGLGYSSYNSCNETLKGTLTNPTNYAASLHALETIVFHDILPTIMGKEFNARNATYKNDLAILHLEVLKRSYHQAAVTTLFTVLSKIVHFFNPKCIIVEDPVRQLFFCDDLKKWVLQVNSNLTFKVNHSGGLRFEKELMCVTTAKIPQQIPTFPINEKQLNEIVTTGLTTYVQQYNAGFIPSTLELEGHFHYISLFNSFINWDRTAFPDFRAYIAFPLNRHIDFLNSQGGLDKLTSSIGTVLTGGPLHRTPNIIFSASKKLYALLTQDNPKVTFSSTEKQALCENKLGLIAQNLSFFIGLVDPALYMELRLPHQNPLVPIPPHTDE